MARKLKVFEARLGFHETVVAAPSRVVAREAWGVHQDVFAEGLAHESLDPAAVEAALARPGVVLRRPAGAKVPFEAEPTALPRVPAAPPRRAAGGAKSPPADLSPPPPPPDRTELDDAERAFQAIEEAWRTEQASLEDQRRRLDETIHAATKAHDGRRRKAERAVADAKRRYRKAGGEA
ncbi:hypothetical protein ACO2Q3_09010 [Caulobacter sp. KR2-114]|uniref:hypothetical protein n=1 Tax=Caulobacter sp. KR2-114 TaxID=3400912 RepID=UPI003C0A3124